MPKLDLRVTVRAQNGHLARLAERMGGVKEAAAEVGISGRTYGQWMNFRSTPGHTSLRRNKSALLRLCELCGERLETIFPDITREEREALCRPRKYDVTAESSALAHGRVDCLTYELDTSGPENEEAAEAIRKALKEGLVDRDRQIIEMRYGLNGQQPLMLKEVACALNLTSERVRQIEMRAIRRLQVQQSVKDKLALVLDG